MSIEINNGKDVYQKFDLSEYETQANNSLPNLEFASYPDLQTRQLLERLNAENFSPLDDKTLKILQAQESKLSTLPSKKFAEIEKIENIKIEGPWGPINCRLYFPVCNGSLPVFVFFHGGGWALGNLSEYDYFCQKIAHQTPSIVVSVEYHLAPQYKFPKPVDECYFATKWVSEHIHKYGGDCSRLAIGGDSAGGNLAAAVTLMTREQQSPKINYQVLIFPVLNNQFDTFSYNKFGEGYYLTKATMQFFWKNYLEKEEDGNLPYASPLKAETLANLPPALIVLANFDPLYDEGLSYADRLIKDEVNTEVKCYNSIHAFINFENELSVANESMEDIAKALHKNLSSKN
jgi:acetyl esterase/lipase